MNHLHFGKFGKIRKIRSETAFSRFSRFSALPFLLAWALFIFSPLIADPDLWGHVRFGQDALTTGHVVRADVYSYLTAGQPWINHEWLTEVLYALAYNAAGAPGLIALNLLLSLLIAALIYWALTRAGMMRPGAVLLAAGLCLVLRPGVVNIRPQVFTYLLFLALTVLLAGYTRRERANPRRPLFSFLFVAATWLILALWVNLHGGVLAGLALLYLWGAGYLAEKLLLSRSLHALVDRDDLTVLAALVVAPFALLLNPYGPRLVAFLLRTATVARPEILEWQGVRPGDLWSLYWLATLVLTAVAVSLSRRPRRLPLLIPLAVVALLPLTAVRHIPLFAVAAPVLAADHFADLWDRLARRIDLSGLANLTGLRMLPLLAAAGLLWLATSRLQAGIQILPASADFPVRAVAALRAASVHGNMATEFNWGEYVLWHLAPAVKVSLDGRRETVYAEAVYRENLDFMLGQGQWDRLVSRPQTDLALVDRSRPAYDLMRAKTGWTLAYEDETAAVFVRLNAPLKLEPASIPATWPANGAGLAFPVE